MSRALGKALRAIRLKIHALFGRKTTAYSHFSAPCTPGAEPTAIEVEEAGPGMIRARLMRDGACVSTCAIWNGADYRERRGYFALGEDEGELVFLETPPEHRGRGYATVLLGDVPAALAMRGYRRLYARIWHSNTASIRAFEKSGWRDGGIVFARAGAKNIAVRE